MKTLGIENKMALAGQTKGDALTPDELTWIKDQFRRKGGSWPRTTPMEAVNVAKTSDELCPKSERHIKLEAAFAAVQDRLKAAQRKVYDEEQAASKADTNGPFNYEPFFAPANAERRAAEAALEVVQSDLAVEEATHRVKQRRALLGIPEPNLISRGLRALGLDAGPSNTFTN
jgi:hypothetical protein